MSLLRRAVALDRRAMGEQYDQPVRPARAWESLLVVAVVLGAGVVSADIMDRDTRWGLVWVSALCSCLALLMLRRLLLGGPSERK